MTKKIVVLISGNGSNLQAIMDGCSSNAIAGQVVAVVSNRPNVYGLQRAADADIANAVLDHKQFETRDDYDLALIELIDKYQPDVVILAGFMRILTANFVNHYQGKMLNIHPSLLPKYQGLNTHQRAIDNGDKEHGVSVHFVTEELDGGPVGLQAKVPIFPEDSADDLAQRIHVQEHRIYPMVTDWLCRERLKMQAQDGEFIAILDHHILAKQGYAID